MRKSLSAATVAIALLVTGVISSPLSPVKANGTPANKTAASGSTTEIVDPTEVVTLLSERIKTTKTTDLILSATAECAITTELTTTGNDEATAFGTVRMWVEIDGKPVPVASTDTDGGRVVFCNRADQRTTSLFDDDDATIETFQETRHAARFNWMALDVGPHEHVVELKAELTKGSTGDASAKAAVGNRTLIIEPSRAANREEVTELGG